MAFQLGGVALEAVAAQGEATGQMLAQHGSGPLAKARGLRRTDAIPHGNDGVEVVVLELAPYLPLALLTNYREILGSCRFLQFLLFVDVLEVKAVVRFHRSAVTTALGGKFVFVKAAFVVPEGIKGPGSN